MKQAFNLTYEAIGFDLPFNSIDRAQLFETCLDFIYQYGELEEDIQEWWRDLPYKEKIEYQSVVFPYELYEGGAA